MCGHLSFLIAHPWVSRSLIFPPACFFRPHSGLREFWCPFCQKDKDLWEDGATAVMCDGSIHPSNHPSVRLWERTLLKSLGTKRLEPQSTGALKSELSYHIHTSEKHQRVKDRQGIMDLARLGTDERRPLVTSLWRLSGSGHFARGGESWRLCCHRPAGMSGASPRYSVSPGHLRYDLACPHPALYRVMYSKDKLLRGV